MNFSDAMSSSLWDLRFRWPKSIVLSSVKLPNGSNLEVYKAFLYSWLIYSADLSILISVCSVNKHLLNTRPWWLVDGGGAGEMWKETNRSRGNEGRITKNSFKQCSRYWQ